MKFRVMFAVLIIGVSSLAAFAPTIEEKELEHKARVHNAHYIKEAIADIKHGWKVVEYFHKGVALNKRVERALTDCWHYAYARNDSSYSIKITDRHMIELFEQFLIELQPHISFYEKQKALHNLKNDLYYFSRESQAEFRSTIEKAQLIILKNLKDYIPLLLRQEIEKSTERVFKDGTRFLFYVFLMKYNNGYTRDDVKYINGRLDLFLKEAARTYPYVSVTQFESWAFSLLQDLLFSECVICMDRKGEQYLSCCKSKAVCKRCIKSISSCPLCRAAIRHS